MQRPWWATDEAEWKGLCLQIVEAAAGVLSNERSLTESSRLLSVLAYSARADGDAEFRMFIGIASATDNYPVGQLAAKWHPETLPELDEERRKVEARFEVRAKEAAERLVARYSNG